MEISLHTEICIHSCYEIDIAKIQLVVSLLRQLRYFTCVHRIIVSAELDHAYMYLESIGLAYLHSIKKKKTLANNYMCAKPSHQ